MIGLGVSAAECWEKPETMQCAQGVPMRTYCIHETLCHFDQRPGCLELTRDRYGRDAYLTNAWSCWSKPQIALPRAMVRRAALRGFGNDVPPTEPPPELPPDIPMPGPPIYLQSWFLGLGALALVGLGAAGTYYATKD